MLILLSHQPLKVYKNKTEHPVDKDVIITSSKFWPDTLQIYLFTRLTKVNFTLETTKYA